jgi:putative membrane protein
MALSLWLTVHGLHLIDSALGGWNPRSGVVSALITAAVIALVNLFVKPVLALLTLPLSCLTFGLFSLVLNAILFWGVAQLMGTYYVNWLGALIGAVLLGVINGALTNLLLPTERPDRE